MEERGYRIWFREETFFSATILFVQSVFTHVASVYANLLKRASVYNTKEFDSHRICLEHQQRRHFIVLGHQYGRRDVI